MYWACWLLWFQLTFCSHTNFSPPPPTIPLCCNNSPSRVYFRKTKFPFQGGQWMDQTLPDFLLSTKWCALLNWVNSCKCPQVQKFFIEPLLNSVKVHDKMWFFMNQNLNNVYSQKVKLYKTYIKPKSSLNLSNTENSCEKVRCLLLGTFCRIITILTMQNCMLFEINSTRCCRSSVLPVSQRSSFTKDVSGLSKLSAVLCRAVSVPGVLFFHGSWHR